MPNPLTFKDNIIVEQQQQHNYLNNGYYNQCYNVQKTTNQHNSLSNNKLITFANKLKRSISHRRKQVRKPMLVKKEIESELVMKQYTENLIQSIIDCDLLNLKKYLEDGANANTIYNNW